MKALFTSILIFFLSVGAFSELVRQTVTYRDGPAELKGYLVYDNAVTGKIPGVLLFHEWWGLNPYIKTRADQMAALGYMAFAADIYGGGRMAKDAAEAGKLASSYRKDTVALIRRADAAYQELLKNPLTDRARTAAIGYCFGGSTALEFARSGAGLKGVVSVHGNLATADLAKNKDIKASVLVLHGASDPYVSAAEVAAFEDSMRQTAVDWQVVLYGGAVHGFSNPSNGSDPSKGVAYNEAADRRSSEAVRMFLGEIFTGK